MQRYALEVEIHADFAHGGEAQPEKRVIVLRDMLWEFRHGEDVFQGPRAAHGGPYFCQSAQGIEFATLFGYDCGPAAVGPGGEPLLEVVREAVRGFQELGVEGDAEDVDGGTGVEAVFDGVVPVVGCAPEGYAFVELGVEGGDAGDDVLFVVAGILCLVSTISVD